MTQVTHYYIHYHLHFMDAFIRHEKEACLLHSLRRPQVLTDPRDKINPCLLCFSSRPHGCVQG